MLTLLKIRNIALVDQLLWELSSGLVAVTGETGAGKSVIVGALKLVLGERADKSLIRSGEEQCSVEAVFALGKEHAGLFALLEENGIDAGDGGELILRRVVGQSTNRQFVNDSPVTLQLLKRIGENLVDLHGPHEHQSLLSTERQLSMLDAYCGDEGILEEWRGKWRIWRDAVATLEEVQRAEAASEQELDLLRFQVEEIDRAQLTAEDEGNLEDRWRRANHSSRLVESAAAMVAALNREDGLQDRLGELQKYARDLEKWDPSLSEKLAGLEQVSEIFQELEDELKEYGEKLDLDQQEFAVLEERMNVLESLKRKYGHSVGEILARRNAAAERLDTIENRAEKLEELTRAVEASRLELNELGKSLRGARKKGAPQLAREISEHLADLGFKQAAFEIELKDLAEPASNGLDEVEFFFGPNPGEPLQPLRLIASSGEISRVMLAVKSALAKQDSTPLMVFDEIDANVGGEIAGAVGRKMAVLGKRHQVVAITHFPQVAATAQSHFVVEKEVKQGRTRSQLSRVQGESRIEELVRMLGGGQGKEARAMAEKLLGA